MTREWERWVVFDLGRDEPVAFYRDRSRALEFVADAGLVMDHVPYTVRRVCVVLDDAKEDAPDTHSPRAGRKER